MSDADNEKRKITNDGRNRTTKSRKIKTFGEKVTYKYLGILEMDIIKHAEMKEKLKRIRPEKEEALQDQTT